MGKVLQLRISLNNIKPEIWRRFFVEDSITFKQLHRVIQTVMGWEDYHLYEFCISDEKIAPEEEGFNLAEASFRDLHNSPEFIELLQKGDAGKSHASLNLDEVNKLLQKIKRDKPKSKFSIKTKISELLAFEGQKFAYIYDFGDCWEHSILIEKIMDKEPSLKYPICVDGERACPSEDCGSIPGYYNLMEIRKNKNHPEYKSHIVDWLGEDYDPELFITDWVNARLQGKNPAPLWIKRGVDEKDEFVSLGNLLKEDSNSIKNIKTLFDREGEYADYLGKIEFTIANNFLENRNLKDKEVNNAITNIKKNYTQKIGFFETDLEKEIMFGLSVALQEKSITHHELRLVFDYILWSIDNRSWIPDKQAYVKWLPYFFRLYDKDEMDKYKLNFTKIARRMGIPQTKINGMLTVEEAEVNDQQKEESRVESEFFSLEGDKKLGFVVENGLINPYITQLYMAELGAKGDFKTIEWLCKKLMGVSNNFPMFEFLLGLNYNNMQNPSLAKFHMEKAIKSIENAPPSIFPPGEKEKTLGNMKRAMKEIEEK